MTERRFARADEYGDLLKGLIKGAGLQRIEAAVLLHVSPDTLNKWLKPATTLSRSPCPAWAVELLAMKTSQKVPAMEANAA